MAAHEFGHVLGYDDVASSNCAGQTVMSGHISWVYWDGGAVACSDSLAMNERFLAPESDEIPYPITPPNCYELYLVEYFWCYNGTTWYQCGSYWNYLTTYCV